MVRKTLAPKNGQWRLGDFFPEFGDVWLLFSIDYALAGRPTVSGGNFSWVSTLIKTWRNSPFQRSICAEEKPQFSPNSLYLNMFFFLNNKQIAFYQYFYQRTSYTNVANKTCEKNKVHTKFSIILNVLKMKKCDSRPWFTYSIVYALSESQHHLNHVHANSR